uniref:NADH dehydrogenase subunit 6 n=1 Tax=Cucujoidea sp. 22 KM-2017 TaxID=2219359 RepID=A0A346RI91_9CUCU|nr:NADH dehydrogenase subunit 6 [Cucujoidea sp. 22 KM-2017]
MIFSIILVSTMFMLFNHPLMMMIILFFQSINIALFLGKMKNFWFSYILLLVMIGGLLILFLYMTSFVYNEKIIFSKLNYFIIFMIFFTLIINYKTFVYSNNTIIYSINKYFNYSFIPMFILLMFYLFIVMSAVIKITNNSRGPLRQQF